MDFKYASVRSVIQTTSARRERALEVLAGTPNGSSLSEEVLCAVWFLVDVKDERVIEFLVSNVSSEVAVGFANTESLDARTGMVREEFTHPLLSALCNLGPLARNICIDRLIKEKNKEKRRLICRYLKFTFGNKGGYLQVEKALRESNLDDNEANVLILTYDRARPAKAHRFESIVFSSR